MKEKVHIKLPKLDLARFSGNSAEWLSFWSTFETAIHNNDWAGLGWAGLNYLKSFLAPEPLKSIQGFSVIASNYPKAIDILKQR